MPDTFATHRSLPFCYTRTRLPFLLPFTGGSFIPSPGLHLPVVVYALIHRVLYYRIHTAVCRYALHATRVTSSAWNRYGYERFTYVLRLPFGVDTPSVPFNWRVYATFWFTRHRWFRCAVGFPFHRAVPLVALRVHSQRAFTAFYVRHLRHANVGSFSLPFCIPHWTTARCRLYWFPDERVYSLPVTFTPILRSGFRAAPALPRYDTNALFSLLPLPHRRRAGRAFRTVAHSGLHACALHTTSTHCCLSDSSLPPCRTFSLYKLAAAVAFCTFCRLRTDVAVHLRTCYTVVPLPFWLPLDTRI